MPIDHMSTRNYRGLSSIDRSLIGKVFCLKETPCFDGSMEVPGRVVVKQMHSTLQSPRYDWRLWTACRIGPWPLSISHTLALIHRPAEKSPVTLLGVLYKAGTDSSIRWCIEKPQAHRSLKMQSPQEFWKSPGPKRCMILTKWAQFFTYTVGALQLFLEAEVRPSRIER